MDLTKELKRMRAEQQHRNDNNGLNNNNNNDNMREYKEDVLQNEFNPNDSIKRGILNIYI